MASEREAIRPATERSHSPATSFEGSGKKGERVLISFLSFHQRRWITLGSLTGNGDAGLVEGGVPFIFLLLREQNFYRGFALEEGDGHVLFSQEF